MVGVLLKAGVVVRDRVMMYKAFVKMVLFYGIYSWVITEEIMKVFEGSHHRISRRIAGRTARRIREEGWEYPLAEEALEEVGLWSIQ